MSKKTTSGLVVSEKMTMNNTALRGILFLGIGLVAIVTFLFAGGVVNSTDGSYWTKLFVGSFGVGLVCPGLLVYRSAKATVPTSQQIIPRPVLVGGVFLFGLSFGLSQFVLGSRYFASITGHHAFIVLMGLLLAQLVASGVGLVRVDAHNADSSVNPNRFQELQQ